MNAKLTLSIDSKVVESAKRRSKRKGISLSKMVENYLRENDPDLAKSKKKGSILDLIGIAGKVPDNFDYDQELLKILTEKHLK